MNLTQKAVMPFQAPTLVANLKNAGETGTLADELAHKLRDLANMQYLPAQWVLIVTTPDRSAMPSAEIRVDLKAGGTVIASKTIPTGGGSDGLEVRYTEVDLYNVGGQQALTLGYEVTASSTSTDSPVQIHGWLEAWQPMVVTDC
jgi:hypothetical protein